MKHSIFIILVLVLGGILAYMLFSDSSSTVTVAGIDMKVEVADTKAERTKGLSGREQLPDNHAMLFVFEKAGRHSFWMKNMDFPIDIFWIDKEGTIVDIKENISPETYPETFAPQQPAMYVLETSAGFAQSHTITIGDKVTGLSTIQ